MIRTSAALLLSILFLPQLHAQEDSEWITFTRGLRSFDEPWYPRWDSSDAYQKSPSGPELYEKHFREVLANQPEVISFACAFTIERVRLGIKAPSGIVQPPNNDSLIRKSRELCADIEITAAHRKPVLMTFYDFSEEEARKRLGLEDPTHDIQASWKIFLRGVATTNDPWYPDRSKAPHYMHEPDGLSTYLEDLDRVEKESPDVFAHVCAYMVEIHRRGLAHGSRNSSAIFQTTRARCQRAAIATAAHVEMANTLFAPAISQEVIDRQREFGRFARTLTPEENARLVWGAWIPEGFRAEDWGESLAESEYRQRINALFDRDPFLGAAICREALIPASSLRRVIPRVATLEAIQAIAVDECSALTIARLEQARARVDQIPVEGYLRAALVPLLDNAEALGENEQAARRSQLTEAFKSVSAEGRLPLTLETIALDPSEPTGYAAFIAHRHGVPSQDLPKWFSRYSLEALAGVLDTLAAERDDPELLRGLAILNLLRGENAAAAEAAASAARATNDARDEVLAGLAKEVGGEAGSLAMVLADCVDDVCRGFLGTLTSVLRELQPATLLNPDIRDAYIASQRAPITPDPLRSIGRAKPSDTPLDKIARMISALHAEWLTASKMPDDIRRQSGLELSDTLYTPHGYRLPNRNELVLRLAVRNPSDDKSVDFIIEQLQWMGIEERDVGLEHLERFYEERLEETGEVEWLRALRALHYLRGDFQEALAASREIMKSKEAASRDIAYLAMTEHLGADDSRRLDELLQQCPPATGDEAYWHAGDDPRTHCQITLWGLSHRLARSLGAVTPRKVAPILLRYPESRELTSQHWLLGLNDVIDFDTGFAISELEKAIRENEGTETGRFLKIWGSMFLSRHYEAKGSWTEAFGATMAYLEAYARLPFDPVDWRRLTTEVDAIVHLDRCCPRSDQGEVAARLARMAIRLGDFEQARYAIESLLWLEMRETPITAGFVRTYLADLANAMLDSNVHQGVPQILSFLRTQPTNPRFNAYLDEIELKLTDMVGRSALLPPVAEPWSSPKREFELAPLSGVPPATVG